MVFGAVKEFVRSFVVRGLDGVEEVRSLDEKLFHPFPGYQGIVDLGKFSLAQSGSNDPSRFSPRIVLDQKEATGRAPRTFSDTADRVDLGGAYRLGRNIDVTAGVR